MNAKLIDGQIRKIESLTDSKVFFDFEFWAESDEDTYGLLCLVQLSNPRNLFIVEMTPDELTISSDSTGLETVKNRIANATGVSDLVFPKLVRFDEKKSDVKGGFQAYLKAHEKPVAVYESIYDKAKEAVQVGRLSISEFEEQGGKIILLGNLSM